MSERGPAPEERMEASEKTKREFLELVNLLTRGGHRMKGEIPYRFREFQLENGDSFTIRGSADFSKVERDSVTKKLFEHMWSVARVYHERAPKNGMVKYDTYLLKYSGEMEHDANTFSVEELLESKEWEQKRDVDWIMNESKLAAMTEEEREVYEEKQNREAREHSAEVKASGIKLVTEAELRQVIELLEQLKEHE